MEMMFHDLKLITYNAIIVYSWIINILTALGIMVQLFQQIKFLTIRAAFRCNANSCIKYTRRLVHDNTDYLEYYGLISKIN